MRHALRIKVSRERINGGLVTCRQTTVRERLLRRVLGSPMKLTVIVPGDSVDEVGIAEIPEAAEAATEERREEPC